MHFKPRSGAQMSGLQPQLSQPQMTVSTSTACLEEMKIPESKSSQLWGGDSQVSSLQMK